MIYEIMYIVPSKYSDSEIEGIQKEVQGLFTKHNAKLEKEMNLGKLKFAYPIKKNTHGTYILSFVEVEGDDINKIDAALRLQGEVLRHLIVKRPEGIPSYDIELTPYVAPISTEGKRVKRAEATATEEESEAPKKAVSKEEIQEQLDEMLEDDTVEETKEDSKEDSTDE
jgi:small subunit ribosomal protein S6